jgi:GNAT superfamily N-acetyltransferase
MSIDLAQSKAEFEALADLNRDYFTWCRQRYADLVWFVEAVFDHQAFDAELSSLSLAYSPPRGRAYLANVDGALMAAGAYRHMGDGICEMKRLYVREEARGKGLARRLCQRLIDEAKDDGYQTMRLDTGDRFLEAIELYRALGFVKIAPYHAYPDSFLPHMVFMEKVLN